MAPTAPLSSSVSSKCTKPPRRLTMEKKAAIIEQLQRSRSQAEVKEEFRISKQTVSDFIKNKGNILEVAAKSTGTGKKNASQAVYLKLEEALATTQAASHTTLPHRQNPGEITLSGPIDDTSVLSETTQQIRQLLREPATQRWDDFRSILEEAVSVKGNTHLLLNKACPGDMAEICFARFSS
ncbi:hypothetical protein MRX96_007291 [Rhipicephalus microplus]